MSVSVADLERGLTRVARLIQVYGEEYWSIVERLDQELEKRMPPREKVKHILSVSAVGNLWLCSHSTFFGTGQI